MDPVPLIGGIVFLGILLFMLEGYRLQRKAMVRQQEAASRSRLALEKQEEAAERGRLSLARQEEAAERGRLAVERQEENIQREIQQAEKNRQQVAALIALQREMVTLLREISSKMAQPD